MTHAVPLPYIESPEPPISSEAYWKACYEGLHAKHEARVTELLNYNNDQVEARRDAQRELDICYREIWNLEDELDRAAAAGAPQSILGTVARITVWALALVGVARLLGIY